MVRNKVLGSRGSVLSLASRGVEIIWKLGLYWSALMYDCLVGRDEEIVPFRARQLRNLLCDLGPSFIKAGQVLANRPDIIREDYMNELCILQDDVPPFPNQVAFSIIEEELGQPLERLFSRISSQTIAAASLGQVYRATLRETGEDVAIKVQRPGIEPIIYRDLFLFRTLASFLNGVSLQKLGCNAELIVDEFGEKLLEELDYTLEATNIEDFLENFKDDPTVKIPQVYKQYSGSRVLVMEWIDGIRCTDPQAIKEAGIDVEGFLTVGVSAALRQLLEFGLFHGDPHPGNIFAMRDGRIAYVDFGNVAVLSQQNKQILIDAVVHAVNEDYAEMANDFTRLGFLASGTDVAPIIPALEAIWQNSAGKGLADFNFRSVTGKFNQLVYNYPIRIPERFSLVIRSLLTQEGICFTLQPDFKFLEVAYPYVAKRLLTDPNPALRERLIQRKKKTVDTRIHWSDPDEGWVGGNAKKDGDDGARKKEPFGRRFADLINNPSESHYQLSAVWFLGVDPQADIEEIKAAYRRLSKEYHPDTTTLPLKAASEKFIRLREAYNVVSREESRRFYDWTLAQEAASWRLQQLRSRLEDPYEQDIRDYQSVPDVVDRLGGRNMKLSDQAMTALTIDIGIIIFCIFCLIYVVFFKEQY
ncbi:hypothetical protein E2562_027259 [Oryza meyeriana var. granulata]|uniref:J domain-containing protein n=1 Tax=Oryza meyeriana var. granulata TaxID=110450 RepID=A0A6G1C945_9ORYZ|nr:hypothetical protein E2562_027259 [Oryza meyeriana var. granulata]